MTKPNDGGPAFPTIGGAEWDDPRNGKLTGGMSLRDMAAFVAMHAMLSRTSLMTSDLAKAAYQHADAMISEREKHK